MDLNHDQQTGSCDRNLLRSRAAGRLGSHSVRNETSSCDKTAAFSRRKHTWISLRAQRDMFLRKDCGDSAPPPIWMIFNSKARSSFYSSHAGTRPLLSWEPVTRNLVTALLLADCRPLKRIRCWGTMLNRASRKHGWVLKQGLHHLWWRIRDPWRRWVLEQGLNYVKSRIREASLQAHPESPPRPKTYS